MISVPSVVKTPFLGPSCLGGEHKKRRTAAPRSPASNDKPRRPAAYACWPSPPWPCWPPVTCACTFVLVIAIAPKGAIGAMTRTTAASTTETLSLLQVVQTVLLWSDTAFTDRSPLGRLEGAVEVPLGRLPGAVDSLPADRDLVVVCHHGVRSALAVRWLQGLGFDRAVNLDGGIDAWARRVEPEMSFVIFVSALIPLRSFLLQHQIRSPANYKFYF